MGEHSSGNPPEAVQDARDTVRRVYAELAQGATLEGCAPSCCGGGVGGVIPIDSVRLGYSPDELAAIPKEAEMGLGCGNPQAIAALAPGETVLDLGSGGGIDCFLAARRVGSSGRVIGVDMTPEMVSRARASAARTGYTNVEFRLGEIEHLPVADASVDVILSNCVINLSPDKPRVYREMYRVLRRGGRIAVSDVVAVAPLPEDLRRDLALLAGCVAGAASVADIEQMLRDAGFDQIQVQAREESRALIRDWFPGRDLDRYVRAATIQGVKP